MDSILATLSNFLYGASMGLGLFLSPVLWKPWTALLPVIVGVAYYRLWLSDNLLTILLFSILLLLPLYVGITGIAETVGGSYHILDAQGLYAILLGGVETAIGTTLAKALFDPTSFEMRMAAVSRK